MQILKHHNDTTHIQRKSFTTIRTLISINPHESLAALEKTRFQTDNDELHAGLGMLTNVVGDLGNVRVVQGGIDFVENEERRRLIAVNGKEQCQGGHGLLATRKMIHVAKALEGRHGVIFDAFQIGFVGVFDVKISITCCE